MVVRRDGGSKLEASWREQVIAVLEAFSRAILPAININNIIWVSKDIPAQGQCCCPAQIVPQWERKH